MALKPSLPKGTRDFLPKTMLIREYILDNMRNVFKKYGFLPIETPAMENASTLTGKYGEEGDRLIFKIMPRGEKAKVDSDKIKAKEALRYDLTVPFARFVVQNQNEIGFPFKRYQIQPVWRAEAPQRGRFREFYQCDADAIGSDSLLLELDFIQIYREVFETLNLKVQIKINNRKLLAGFAEVFGIQDRLTDFTICLDKLDKIGEEGVVEEMKQKGFEEKALQGFRQIASLKGSNAEILKQIIPILQNSEIGRKGIDELNFLIQNIDENCPLSLDLTLARGLDYYTGAIFEVVSEEVKMGSIGGGGRYDDLTSIFGLKNVSGIGISFGLDRIQLVLEELDRLPKFENQSTQILFFNFGEELALESFKWVKALRAQGIKADIYPDVAKFKKQIAYASNRGVSFIALIEKMPEDGADTLQIRNMQSREEEFLNLEQLIAKLNNN
tara:strand:+ start:57254 stop:58579 length:1326 start_codon:yes stop_codon:yes gene_type:complete